MIFLIQKKKMKRIKNLLIANRGEIALRIIQACRELDISPFVIYSESDKDSLACKAADKAFFVGKSNPQLSYLNLPKIIKIAKKNNVDAIHPGYGFLSESPLFPKVCKEEGIIFVGPPARVMRQMGLKIEAKRLAQKLGIPVVPGSEGLVDSVESAKKVIKRMGLPVMIKASAGGGGRGMRVVNRIDELEKAFYLSKSEANESFGDDSVYIEKYIKKPRHVEVQILGDNFGNVVHLFERECSVQRNHQKLIEEAPCPVLSEEERKRITSYAVRIAKAIGYRSAGTVEFIMDYSRNIYFNEMNTRIQVEHGITELITGIDIVKEQIRISSGFPVSFKQRDVRIFGHAFECRINAENPKKNFEGSFGRITNYSAPKGIGLRLDTFIEKGTLITPFYDSLIAKLMSFGRDRNEALGRMLFFLNQFIVEGIETNLEMHRLIFKNKGFIKADLSTDFVKDNRILETLKKKEKPQELLDVALIAATINEFYKKEQTKELDSWVLSSRT